LQHLQGKMVKMVKVGNRLLLRLSMGIEAAVLTRRREAKVVVRNAYCVFRSA